MKIQWVTKHCGTYVVFWKLARPYWLAFSNVYRHYGTKNHNYISADKSYSAYISNGYVFSFSSHAFLGAIFVAQRRSEPLFLFVLHLMGPIESVISHLVSDSIGANRRCDVGFHAITPDQST